MSDAPHTQIPQGRALRPERLTMTFNPVTQVGGLEAQGAVVALQAQVYHHWGLGSADLKPQTPNIWGLGFAVCGPSPRTPKVENLGFAVCGPSTQTLDPKPSTLNPKP